MVKVVLLDYGRIIAPEDGDPVVQSVYGAHPDDQMSATVFSDLRKDLAMGLVDEATVYDKLVAAGTEPTPDYEEKWAVNIKNHMYPAPAMLQLIDEMKAAGYKVMLLSNVWPLSAKLIRDNGWYEPFEKLFLSCDMGAAKPSKAIYDAVIESIDYEPSDIVFVDDKDVNMIYPREIGMQTIVASSPDDAALKLRDFLNL